MLRYLLVRHALAESSHPDAPLTAEGRYQAEALARRFRDCPFRAVWSSDMARARETAEVIVAGRDETGLIQSPALREIEIPGEVMATGVASESYASWEREAVGLLADRLRVWQEEVGAVLSRPSPRPSPSGRGGTVLPLPEGEGRGEGASGCSFSPTLLVVSHGGPLRVLICLLLGLPPEMHWSFHLDHAGVTVIERAADMGTITLLNERCHLEPRAGGVRA